jgi:hypothetical protein
MPEPRESFTQLSQSNPTGADGFRSGKRYESADSCRIFFLSRSLHSPLCGHFHFGFTIPDAQLPETIDKDLGILRSFENDASLVEIVDG